MIDQMHAQPCFKSAPARIESKAHSESIFLKQAKYSAGADAPLNIPMFNA